MNGPISDLAPVHTLRGHRGWIGQLAWSVDGRFIASPSQDGTVRIWESAAGSLAKTLQAQTTKFWATAFDPSGNLLAGAGDKGDISVWSVQDGRLLATLSGHKDAVFSLSFHPREPFLASAGIDRTTRLWDVAQFQEHAVYDRHENVVLTVCIDPTGRYLASGGLGQSVRIWRLNRFKLVGELWVGSHPAWCSSVAFNQDGSMLAAGGSDGRIQLFDVIHSRFTAQGECHNEAITSIQFSHDGQVLASRGMDGFVRLWRTPEFQPILTISAGHASECICCGVAFHPRLASLASVGSAPEAFASDRDQVVHVWRLRDSHLIHNEPFPIPRIPVSNPAQPNVADGHSTAELKFEERLVLLKQYLSARNVNAPSCFISYAWGVEEHEQWVEQRLAPSLQRAGVQVVLDRWENARVGASLSRFVARITACDRVIVVGTPLYRAKYENIDSHQGSVVAAEVDVISNRLLGTEEQKQSVLPCLLGGEKETSFPPLLHGRVFADFRNADRFFKTTFDLVLSLYGVTFSDAAIIRIREL